MEFYYLDDKVLEMINNIKEKKAKEKKAKEILKKYGTPIDNEIKKKLSPYR